MDRYEEFECCRTGTKARWMCVNNLVEGNSVLDIGCAHGDGCEYVDPAVAYTGIDANSERLDFENRAWKEHQNDKREFLYGDFREFVADKHWDTIVALEILEHIEDGIEWAQKLKDHCDTLIISVPHDKDGVSEEVNGHVLRNLTRADFPDFVAHKIGNYSMTLIWRKNNE